MTKFRREKYMKKRFPAILLALALCVGLAVPAFAAEDEQESADAMLTTYTLGNSGILIDYKTGFYEERDIQLEDWTYPEESQASPFEPQLVPKGVDMTMTVTDLEEDENLSFMAWSDPDGDGVYDHRVFFTEDGTWEDIVLLPIPEDGRYDAGGGRLSNWCDVRHLGFDQAEDGSYTISADRLHEIFGADTLLYLAVYDELHSDKGGWEFLITDEAPRLIFDVFTDVSANQWFTDSVVWALSAEVTNGTTETTFEPDTTCTQAQILTFLWRAAGKPEITDKVLPFEVDEAYRGAVLWADDMGMIDRGTFDPSAPCTRSAAVRFIWQAFLSPEAEEAAGFTDVSADADYAAAVSWAVANGITNGTDMDAGLFSPDEICSRGHIVTFLYRAYIEQARLTVD